MFVEKVIPKEPDVGLDGFDHLPRAAERQPFALDVDKYQFQIVNEYRRKRRIRLLYEAVETSIFRKKIGIETRRGVFILLRPCPRKCRAVGSYLSVFTNPARRLVISAEPFDFVIGIYKNLEKENFKKCLSASFARAREERDSFNSLYSSLYILILLSLENSCVCRSFVD